MGKTKTTSQTPKVSPDLVSVDRDSFGGDYDAAVVEQWKTCVETANSITEKRNVANGIFITVNTALFAVITFSLDYRNILLAAVGIIICVLWIQLLDNYKRLNEAKYDIINEIEAMLPLSPFKAEWTRLCKQGNYIGLTKIEKMVPIVFLVLYGMAVLWPLLKLLLQLICPCLAN